MILESFKRSKINFYVFVIKDNITCTMQEVNVD